MLSWLNRRLRNRMSGGVRGRKSLNQRNVLLLDYYKRNEFDEQKEFRISLPQLRIEHQEIYQIGSLLDIAYLVPLKC